jgi:stress response protein YsnF
MDQSDAIREVVDQPAVDRDGEDVGRVVDVFIDEETDAPKWVSLRAEDEDALVLAPIRGGDLEARPVRVDAHRAQIVSAPRLASNEKRVSPEEEAEIERHYRDGSASERDHATEAPVVDDRPIGAELDAPIEVVRSEEDLVVDTRVVGTERVRLIKRIVTEQVTRTVDVRREELVIEREPLAGAEREVADTGQLEASEQAGATTPPATGRKRIADRLKERLPSLPAVALGKLGTSGGEPFAGETTEITLMQEEVVVSKRIVPRERIRVRKNVVTEQREITDTLRSEQVDIDSGAEPRVS